MTFNELRAACLACPAAEETVPFGPGTLVFKVMGKMFALLPETPPADAPLSITLKADPYVSQMLRDAYPAVTPAYHMNKQHWIGVTLDGSVPDDEVHRWIRDSYALVVRGLTRAQRAALGAL